MSGPAQERRDADPATERALWDAARRGEEREAARDALFTAYVPLARRIAARHHAELPAGEIDYADLRQWAFAGLLEAIDRFDVDRGIPFAAFARKRISGSVLDGIARSSEWREQASHARRQQRERARSLGGEDLDALDGQDAMQALVDIATGLAIGFMLEDAELGASGDRPDNHPGAYESVAWRQTVNRLADALESVDQRERMIIRRHYFDGLSFDAIGRLFGISKGRVSQLHRKTLAQLRKRLATRGVFHVQG